MSKRLSAYHRDYAVKDYSASWWSELVAGALSAVCVVSFLWWVAV